MSIAKKSQKGVIYYDPSKTYEGYTLFAPEGGYDAWLIDMRGQIVYHWSLVHKPCFFARLLPNGNLLYCGREEENPQGPKMDVFDQNHNLIATLWFGGGQYLVEIDSDNNLVWKYEDPLLTHDFYRMENGHTMVIKYVQIPDDLKNEVKGGIPIEPEAPMWCDALNEVNPKGQVIWEWLAYEHLDPKIDIICPLEHRVEWTHMNTCTVLPDGNILGSFRHTNTICIIDKDTGNISWRWGPGELAHQHEPVMLDNGNILVFDNGAHRAFSRFNYSRVLEVNPRTNKIEWEYKADPPFTFFSSVCGGCQRLPNGNTLITESDSGRIFEITYEGEIVWEYISPFYGPYRGQAPNNWIYRAYRYGPEYSGLKGKALDPNNYQWFNAVYGPEALKR